MKIAVINYGMGNLASVRRAFEDIGAQPYVAEHPSALYDADKIVLPGVGAFGEAMTRLQNYGWIPVINEMIYEKRKAFLGICLGMQMLATRGEEGGDFMGLDLIPGKVVHLEKFGCSLRIPHVGWNELKFQQSDAFFNRIPEYSDVYFVHSFAFLPDRAEDLLATTDYGVAVPAIVRHKNVFGCQFHPEKSSKVGRQLLINFLEYVPC